MKSECPTLESASARNNVRLGEIRTLKLYVGGSRRDAKNTFSITWFKKAKCHIELELWKLYIYAKKGQEENAPK